MGWTMRLVLQGCGSCRSRARRDSAAAAGQPIGKLAQHFRIAGVFFKGRPPAPAVRAHADHGGIPDADEAAMSIDGSGRMQYAGVIAQFGLCQRFSLSTH